MLKRRDAKIAFSMKRINFISLHENSTLFPLLRHLITLSLITLKILGLWIEF